MGATGPGRWSAAEQDEIWARWRKGESFRSIGRRFGTHLHAIRRFLAQTGGCRLPPPRRAPDAFAAAEREEVSRGLAAGESYRATAARLGRSHTTVSERPKASVLAQRPALRAAVEGKLRLRWSPQQIAAWLPRAYPDDPALRVSHETLYLSLFVQPRGVLRRELTRYLRTGRAMHCPSGARAGGGRGQLRGTVSIRERPAEAEDRAVPGHWEGDLVFGAKHSAVGTLVERTTRYVLLFPTPAGHKAPAMRTALAAAVARLPVHLRRSLAWDHGKEMAEHVRFTADTGLQVYFCDPRSPWQRGTNENTNGLLRQYLLKSADLKALAQDDLDAIAAELNGRPRQTLGWQTPAERYLVLTEAGWRLTHPAPMLPPRPVVRRPPETAVSYSPVCLVGSLARRSLMPEGSVIS